ncbi:zinc finger BED domain-containing protein 4 [Trichonephila clavata]|uniref:Zinc finger BED domain-containing protein 4 n=1 Tax=Trichonephila clavata TaxID=2740835 RepID=A0A8X6LE78_TRICU|nr:zinc finger BED domain-containing protein 4 [Trichonephila clavata]
MLEYSGFKKILNPIVNAIGNHFSVNSENIKLLIPETAVKIVSEISTALEKKVISLKIDIATRLNRLILGINAQLIIGGRINLFTLGMTELKDKHTGIYIKNMVEKVLEKYNIDIQQIYSITTDNGANMISFVNLLGSEIEDEVIEMENENFETRHHFEDGVFFYHNFSFNKLIGIRCAAHTLQLAIKDSIKNADFNEFISDARGLVKKLRIPSLMLKFKDVNTKRPILDCPTRWNSTYNMLKSLLECKDFSSSLVEHNLDYYFADSKWVKLKLIVDTLQPLTEATLKLQSEELTLSDFYGIWTHCKIKFIRPEDCFADVTSRNKSPERISRIVLTCPILLVIAFSIRKGDTAEKVLFVLIIKNLAESLHACSCAFNVFIFLSSLFVAPLWEKLTESGLRQGTKKTLGSMTGSNFQLGQKNPDQEKFAASGGKRGKPFFSVGDKTIFPISVCILAKTRIASSSIAGHEFPHFSNVPSGTASIPQSRQRRRTQLFRRIPFSARVLSTAQIVSLAGEATGWY